MHPSPHEPIHITQQHLHKASASRNANSWCWYSKYSCTRRAPHCIQGHLGSDTWCVVWPTGPATAPHAGLDLGVKWQECAWVQVVLEKWDSPWNATMDCASRGAPSKPVLSAASCAKGHTSESLARSSCGDASPFSPPCPPCTTPHIAAAGANCILSALPPVATIAGWGCLPIHTLIFGLVGREISFGHHLGQTAQMHTLPPAAFYCVSACRGWNGEYELGCAMQQCMLGWPLRVRWALASGAQTVCILVSPSFEARCRNGGHSLGLGWCNSVQGFRVGVWPFLCWHVLR